MTRSLSICALLTALAATPAIAQQIGETYRCPAADGPDVLAVVGRTDLLSELAGRDMDPHDLMIMHVQMVAMEEGAATLGHLAMTEAALAECTRDMTDGPFDRIAFDTGLEAFMEAVRTGEATIAETDPAGAYRAALDHLEG
ncbi:hypothetical protein [Jannaschia formosa]|uniref:hypothetical protein n=1 Tax=Jannaschia formosa TaxID=2259592 RepID=UPI000E1C0994|nr:hypothetical protein [Jannaschia formosa]TFL18121.1 hypothetical protein DR046_11825 [Jannaschia formosa]